MKIRVCVTLSIIALFEAQGFVLPSPSSNLLTLGHVSIGKRPSLLVRCSMAIERTEWKDLQQFNVELDRLAELSGKHGQPVISRAAECEAAWEKQVQDHDTSRTVAPDTVSFNTVLKAWSKCCQALTDSDRKPQLTQELGHSVPVYTPRDAAERATTLLLKQLDTKDGSVPDVTSFNVVIGESQKEKRNIQRIANSYFPLVFFMFVFRFRCMGQERRGRSSTSRRTAVKTDEKPQRCGA
jgi:hypothetical protein